MEIELNTHSFKSECMAKKNIAAVFVVQFDVHKGNVIEWQYPEDFNLEGIEYQAICSGLHRIKSDVIYFSRENLYGISVFQNISANIERGAYMKAIGLLVKPTENTDICGDIWNHKAFLQKEISKHMVISSTIEPDRYEHLKAYFSEHKYERSNLPGINDTPLNISIPESINDNSVNYNLKLNLTKGVDNHSFSLDSLTEFVKTFGPDIFVLWKAALLRKRIMLENMPPMETACKFVYNIYLLSQIPAQYQNHTKHPIPKFTVSVNDIPELEKAKESYIACTPDSIFQVKSNLYDLLVTLPQPTELSTHSRPILKSNILPNKHNAADFMRFRIMWNLMGQDGWKHISAAEPKDVLSIMSATLTGFYYWLYDDTNTTRRVSTWQNLFAGHPHRSSEHDLLLFHDHEDATEIGNNEVLEAVAARASADILLQEEQNEKNQHIIRFFQNLTSLVLEKLRSIISINEEDGLDLIPIYPKDMVQLGLDPQSDALFIVGLAELYFKKKVQVYGLQSIGHIKDCCCCKKSSGSIYI